MTIEAGGFGEDRLSSEQG